MKEKHTKTVLLILGIAIIARILFTVSVYEPLSDSYFWYWKHPPDKFDWKVDDKYDEIARNILHGRGFKIMGGTDNRLYPSLKRTPVYPYMLAAQFFLFGQGFWINLLINITYQSLICVILFYLTFMIYNDKKIAMISAIIWALYPLPMLQAMGPHSEAVYELFLVSFVYFFYRYYKYKNTQDLVLFSVFLVIITLTRPITLPFPVAIIIIALFHKGFSFNNRMKQIIIVILIFAAGVSPWIYRGYKITGEVIPLVSYKQPINYYMLEKSDTDLRQEGFMLKILNEVKHPVSFIRNYLTRLLRFWYYGHSKPVRIVNALLQFPFLILTIIGIWWSVNQRKYIFPILFISIYFWFTYSAVHAISRYSFPIIALLCPFASVGIIIVMDKMLSKKSSA